MIAAPIILLAAVIELVRRRRLREDYALMWLATFSLLFLLSSVLRDTLLEIVAEKMGILYPPAALFVLGFGMMLLIVLQLSIVITRLSRQNQQAAQHIALLKARVRDLEKHAKFIDDPPAIDPPAADPALEPPPEDTQAED